MKFSFGWFGTLDLADWFRGLIGGFIQGGAGAIVTSMAITTIDPMHFNVRTGAFYTLAGTVFAVNGALGAASFLSKKPIPDLKTVVTTVQKTQILPGAPPTTVVTTKQETSEQLLHPLPPPDAPKAP